MKAGKQWNMYIYVGSLCTFTSLAQTMHLQLFLYIDRLLNQMNNHKIPTNFYIDLSKAFDSLQHDILLEKLPHYGLTNKAIALFKKLFKQSQTICSAE